MNCRPSRPNSDASGRSSGRMVFLLHWAGVATSLSAALLAALTLPTALLGAAGAVACLAIGAAVLATTRGRSPGGSAA